MPGEPEQQVVGHERVLVQMHRFLEGTVERSLGGRRYHQCSAGRAGDMTHEATKDGTHPPLVDAQGRELLNAGLLRIAQYAEQQVPCSHVAVAEPLSLPHGQGQDASSGGADRAPTGDSAGALNKLLPPLGDEGLLHVTGHRCHSALRRTVHSTCPTASR